MNRSEIVRREILDQCYVHRPIARDAERMAKLCRVEGELADCTAAEFEREASYLAGKNLIEAEREAVAQEHVRWKITAQGIDHVERDGHRV
jgi:hypothetical protein